MSKNDNASQQSAGIQVDMDANLDTGIVFAVLTQADFQEALTPNVIHEKLQRIGVDNWDIQPSAIDDVLNKVKKGQVGRIILGAKKDASVQITVSGDKMQAFASVSPAKGGAPLTKEGLLEVLKSKKISEKRIVDDAINKALSATTEIQVELASGKYPIRGKDSEFIPLTSNNEEQQLAPDEHDNIDFLAGRVYLNVTQGTPILKRTPAEPGKIGQDIYGRLIQPENGTDIPFEMPLEGASLSPSDPNTVIADIDGHPVFSPHSVKVDPTLHFNNIDLSTGHVEFRGSVDIKGDVNPGMKVIATGDIFIKGTVERAYVKSGANITIQGGVVGDVEAEVASLSAEPLELEDVDTQAGIDDFDEEDEAPIHYECEIIAAGDITIKYANVSKLSATNIEAREYIFNSWVEARRAVTLGQSGGKGKLVGGKTIAGHSVIAKILGSQAYNKTKLRIGSNKEERILHKKLLFLRKKRQEQVFNLKQLLFKIPMEKIKIPDSDEAKKSEKINHALSELDVILSDINRRVAKLEVLIDVENDPFIKATNTCFPNVFMTIFNGHAITQLESKASTFIRDGRKVIKKT